MLSDKNKKIFLGLALTASCTIFIDFLTGLSPTQEIVEQKRHYSQRLSLNRPSSSEKYGLITSEGQIPCSYTLYRKLSKDDTVDVYRTQILDEIVKVKVGSQIFGSDTYSIYSRNGVFPIGLILSSFLALIFRNRSSNWYDNFLITSNILTIYLAIALIANNWI